MHAIHTIMSHDDDLHHHWQALVLAMASCTDNFLVGLCTGVANRPFLSAKVLWGIATCNATGSLVAAAAGGAFVSVVASTGYISSKVMTTLLVIASATVPYRQGVLRILYWNKFDLEVADRRSRYRPKKKCPNRWRSHLLRRMRQFLKRASNWHQWLFILFD